MVKFEVLLLFLNGRYTVGSTSRHTICDRNVVPEKCFPKIFLCIWHGAVAPKGCPQMPNMLRFVAIFSCIPISCPSPPFFPHSLPYLPSPISPRPSLSKGEQKFSYRGQNALSIIKHTNAIPSANIILFLSEAPRPVPSSVRSSVRLFVRSSVTNLWTLYFENELTNFNANWHKCPHGGQGHERSTSGVRMSKIKVTGGQSYIWKPGGDIILDPLSRLDRGIEWATEMHASEKSVAQF